MTSRFLVCFLGLIASLDMCFAETFKMRDGVIRTRVSSKQLNRISVKNDRIDRVTGLEEAFQFETNEKTGDGYIKPTEANGKEPIAVSLTTVSGRTQELLLQVDDGEPNTIILENDDEAFEDFALEENADVNEVPMSSSYETAITEAMKKLAREELEPIRLAIKPKKKVAGFNVKHLGSYNAGSFVGEKFEITCGGTTCDPITRDPIANSSNVMIDLKEKDFWNVDDVALSFSDLKICKGRKVILYVLVRK